MPATGDGLRMEEKTKSEPLKLNVYDLTDMNGYMYWFGLGVYHSAIEAYGIEYAYGAHDYPSSGVFEVEPQQCPGFKFRKSMTIGTVWMGPDKFRDFIEELACEYPGDSYHLLFKNCNHFCEDVCKRLLNRSLPGWINRLAKIGSLCSCFLPDGLQAEELNYDEIYNDSSENCSDEARYQRLHNCSCSDNGASVRKRHLISSAAFMRSISLKDRISCSRDYASLSKPLKEGILFSRSLKDQAFSKKLRESSQCCTA